MENIIAEASQYGALGLITLASFWYINKLSNIRTSDNKENTKILLEMNKEFREVVEKNTNAFQELKNIIQSRG